MENQEKKPRDWEREKGNPSRGGEHEWKQPGQGGRDKERPQQPGKKS